MALVNKDGVHTKETALTLYTTNKMNMKAILITLLLICFNAYSQKKASFIATIGQNSGIGATIIMHTPDGAGVYVEYQRKFLESQILSLSAQNFAFGISFPTAKKEVAIGAGLGMMQRELKIITFEDIPKEYTIMLNSHITYTLKRLVLKTGVIMNPKVFTGSGELWLNAGIGFCIY